MSGTYGEDIEIAQKEDVRERQTPSETYGEEIEKAQKEDVGKRQTPSEDRSQHRR